MAFYAKLLSAGMAEPGRYNQGLMAFYAKLLTAFFFALFLTPALAYVNCTELEGSDSCPNFWGQNPVYPETRCYNYCAKQTGYSGWTGLFQACAPGYTAGACTSGVQCYTGSCGPEEPKVFANRQARGFRTIYFDDVDYNSQNHSWDENTDYPRKVGNGDYLLYLNGFGDNEREDKVGCEIGIRDRCVYSITNLKVRLVDELGNVIADGGTAMDCLPEPASASCNPINDPAKTCRVYFDKETIKSSLVAGQKESRSAKVRCEIEFPGTVDGEPEPLASDYTKLSFSNEKATEKYSGKQAFLVSNEDWRYAFSALPVALWEKAKPDEYCPATNPVLNLDPYHQNMKCGYPLFLYDPNEEALKYRDEGRDTGEVLDSIAKVIYEYAPEKVISLGPAENATYANSVLANSPSANKIFAPDISLYSFWKVHSLFVVADPDNYEAGMMAAQLASYLNAPLLFPSSDNKDEWEGQLVPKRGEEAAFVPKLLIVVGSLSNSSILKSNAGITYRDSGDKAFWFSSSPLTTFSRSSAQSFIDRLINRRGNPGRWIVLVNPKDIKPEYCEGGARESYCKMSMAAPLYASALNFRIGFVNSDPAIGIGEIINSNPSSFSEIMFNLENLIENQVYPKVASVVSQFNPHFILFLSGQKAIPVTTAEFTEIIRNDGTPTENLRPYFFFNGLNSYLLAYYLDRDLDDKPDFAFDNLYAEFVSEVSAHMNRAIFVGTFKCPVMNPQNFYISEATAEISPKVSYLGELLLDYTHRSILGSWGPPAPESAYRTLIPLAYKAEDAEKYLDDHDPTKLSTAKEGEISCALASHYIPESRLYNPPPQGTSEYFQFLTQITPRWFTIGQQRNAVGEYYNTTARTEYGMLGAIESIKSIDNIVSSGGAPSNRINEVSIDPMVANLMPEVAIRLLEVKSASTANSKTLQQLAKETRQIFESKEKILKKVWFEKFFYWNKTLNEIMLLAKNPFTFDSPMTAPRGELELEVWYDGAWLPLEKDGTWLKATVSGTNLYALTPEGALKWWNAALPGENKWVDVPLTGDSPEAVWNRGLKKAMSKPDKTEVRLKCGALTYAHITIKRAGSWMAIKRSDIYTFSPIDDYITCRFSPPSTPEGFSYGHIELYALTDDGVLNYYYNTGFTGVEGWIPVEVYDVYSKTTEELIELNNGSKKKADGIIATYHAMYPWFNGSTFLSVYHYRSKNEAEAITAQIRDNQSALLDYLNPSGDVDESAQSAIKCIHGIKPDGSSIEPLYKVYSECGDDVRELLSKTAKVPLIFEGPKGSPGWATKMEYNQLLVNAETAREFYGYTTQTNQIVAHVAITAILTIVTFGAGAAASNVVLAGQSAFGVGSLSVARGWLGLVAIGTDIAYASYNTKEAWDICNDKMGSWDLPVGSNRPFAAADVGPVITSNARGCTTAVMMAGLSWLPLVPAFAKKWVKAAPKQLPSKLAAFKKGDALEVPPTKLAAGDFERNFAQNRFEILEGDVSRNTMAYRTNAIDKLTDEGILPSNLWPGYNKGTATEAHFLIDTDGLNRYPAFTGPGLPVSQRPVTGINFGDLFDLKRQGYIKSIALRPFPGQGNRLTRGVVWYENGVMRVAKQKPIIDVIGKYELVVEILNNKKIPMDMLELFKLPG